MKDKNNLYTNLVNFYNLNDENFKEFLADLYKELLTNHRDVQYVREHLTDEICKILDKYLIDGKLNINIKDVVDNFLESGLEGNKVVTDIKNKLVECNTQLENIENKQILNFLDYGIPNDANIDNTPFLEKALDELNKTGGSLVIPEGEWYFKTPLNYKKWLFGCKIYGTGRGIQNNETNSYITKGVFGTRLVYTGDGTFITFNGKMNSVTIENLAIQLTLPTSYGLKFNYTFHRGILRDCTINGGAGGVELNTGTYVSIDNLRFTTSSSVAEYGIRIGKTDTNYTTEFIYVDKCSFDFGKLSNGNGIEIFKCSGGVWLSRLDICNTYGTGFLIDNENNKSINYFNLRDVNFSGVSTALEFIPRSGNIGGIFIKDVRHGLNNENINEKFIYVHRVNPSYTVSLNVVKSYLRLLNTSIIPEYIVYLDGCNQKETYIELTSGNDITKLSSPIYMTNDCIVKDYRINYSGRLTINFANETPTGSNANYKDYKLLISNMYHAHSKKPIIMFTSNTYQQVGFIKSEITDGSLYAYIRVPIDLTTSTINLCYNIIGDNLVTQ